MKNGIFEDDESANLRLRLQFAIAICHGRKINISSMQKACNHKQLFPAYLTRGTGTYQSAT